MAMQGLTGLGSGSAGLAVATACSQAGHPVTLLERGGDAVDLPRQYYFSGAGYSAGSAEGGS